MITKKWYQSKIFWINFISIILEIFNLFMNNPIIPKEYTGVFTLVVNVLTIVLRFLSKSSIGFGGGGNIDNGNNVINEVYRLPVIGVIGQWYHLPDGGSTYWYYLDGTWHSVDNAAIGGGTVGTPK